MRKNRKTGSYSRKRKAETADRYGQFKDGRRLTGDTIAGRRCFEP
jgi:hypothetical protein